MLNQQQEIYLFFFGQFFISRIASTATDGKERNLVDDGGFGPVVYFSQSYRDTMILIYNSKLILCAIF